MKMRRGLWIAIVLVAIVVITTPVLLVEYNGWRIDHRGSATTAEVTRTQPVPGGRNLVAYRLPADVDPEQRTFTGVVDDETFERAQATEELEIRYLPGEPSVHRIDGAVGSHLLLWMTIAADLVLLAFLALALRFTEKPEKPLVLLATEDVVRCRPAFSVEEVDVARGEFVIRGDVVTIGDGEIGVHVGDDREVRVILGEYRNPVGYQQPAEVRGRRVED